MLTPADEPHLAAVVADAAARKTPLAIAGSGTRSGLGRPMQTATTVSTLLLTGVTLYEPAELVLSARAGTPLREIETLLAGNHQRLAFEPMDHRGIYGSSGTPTIGAVAAANLSGPRRIQAGAARDNLIGLRAVTVVAEDRDQIHPFRRRAAEGPGRDGLTRRLLEEIRSVDVLDRRRPGGVDGELLTLLDGGNQLFANFHGKFRYFGR